MAVVEQGGELGGQRPPAGRSRWQAAFASAYVIRYDLSLVLAILAVLWIAILSWVTLERRGVEADALRTAASIAGAAEQGVSRTIEAMDQRLRFAREAFRRDPAGFSLGFIAEGSGYADGMMMQLAIIDPAGMLSQTNLGKTDGHVDLSDRAHYRVHLDNPADILYISAPVLGRISNRWSVQFTRKLFGPDGSFAGVIVGSLDPYWLTQFQEMLDISGRLLLIGDDGVVRASAPDQNVIGKNLGDTNLGRLIRTATHGNLLVPADQAGPGTQSAPRASSDPVADIVSFRRLRNHPLTVVVGLDPAPVFAPFERARQAALAVGAGLTILILGAGALMVRNRFGVLTSRAALRNAIENIDQGLVMVDGNGRLSVCNHRFTDLLQIPAAAAAAGTPFDALVPRNQATSAQSPQSARHGADPALSLHEEARADGSLLEVRTHRIGNGGMVRTYTDITSRRRSEAQVRFLAHHDALTGLPNRVTLEGEIRANLEAARETGGRVAVFCLDLDRFKLVNDTLGHSAGDELLRQAAHRLQDVTRAQGLAARLGGDEFVIVQPEIANVAAAVRVAQAIVDAFKPTFLLGEREMSVGISVGVAVSAPGTQSVEDLLKSADTALYEAKENGRGSYSLFEAAMEDRVRERSELEQDLAQAIAAQSFSLAFQPIFGREPGIVESFEALLRWRHPTRGWVPPSEFIPIAEESRLILPLGRWVLEQACIAAKGWNQPYRVAVNLSPIQIQAGGIAATVAEILAATGLDPARLVLEVTEGVLIENVATATTVLSDLKQQGVRLALDDFGTGYSSLGTLSRFTFDKLKIDKSFTQKLAHDAGAQAIVEAIIAMGRSLSLSVTAEGVETEQQLAILKRLGCDEYQGFLLGRPDIGAVIGNREHVNTVLH